MYTRCDHNILVHVEANFLTPLHIVSSEQMYELGYSCSSNGSSINEWI
jgi:hypothetical protein